MKKIHVERYGTIHFHAICESCEFSAGILTDETETAQDVRNAVYRHVRATGHAVSIEAGTSTLYSLIHSQK